MVQLEQHIELAEKKNSKQFSFFKVRETMLDNINKMVALYSVALENR